MGDLTRCLLCKDLPHEGYLCKHHRLEMAHWIADVVEAYALLDDVIEPGSIPAEPGAVKRRRTDEAPAPVRLEVIALRDTRNWSVTRPGEIPSVLAELASWSRVVREDRSLSTPDHALTVASEAQLLTTHLDWICRQEWVDELRGVLKTLRRTLNAAIGEPTVKPIGKCPVILTITVTDEDQTRETTKVCGGPLFADRWGAMKVQCAACGEVWDEAYIERMADIIRGA